ncbi:odorant receptor 59a-like [Drosophila novamexicana]|uniref:odorant receptor 59a-like n=1 Tax=Drosophila novamexicana TaxID=47314 RepID=UPI0011E58884|nr:odorant receptor 59a-like [Drosophila novamexicana]
MLINSLSFFRSHWTVWKIIGVTYKKVKWTQLYIVYSLLSNLIVTVWYPLHLGIMLFRNKNFSDDILNLTTFATCLACSLKTALYAYNFEKVEQMEQLLKLLDLRIKSAPEKAIYSQLRTQLRNILYVVIGIYLPIGVFAEFSFIFKAEPALMYPAWFPFDYVNSTRNFYIAHVYQIMGIGFQILQNYANDCFPAVMLCLISAHIKMLYVRFEQVGEDDAKDAEDQLEACITDHKRLLELFRTIESFMSLPMLIQFAVTGLNICTSIAGLLFFVTEPMSITYFLFYALAIPLQIFPICYYGKDNELWFGKLHYSAFSCNWTAQHRSFKKKLMMFVERSLKKSTAMAGGMLRIHVDTFFSTLKFAYSLFTIIIRMRK